MKTPMLLPCTLLFLALVQPTLALGSLVITGGPVEMLDTDKYKISLVRLITADPVDVEAWVEVELTPWPTEGSTELKIARRRTGLGITGISATIEQNLAKDRKARVRVHVPKIARQGHYEAAFILVAGKFTSDLSVAIDVEAIPQVTALDSELSFNLVNCWTSLTCALAGLFLEGDPQADGWMIELENDSLSQMEITPRLRFLPDAAPGNPSSDFSFVDDDGNRIESLTAASGERESFTLKVDRKSLGAGRYSGDLRFQARQQAGASTDPRARQDVVVTATVQVRHGVVWVLLFLLAGIVAGRLSRQLTTPEAKARQELYRKTVEIERRARDLSDSISRLASESRLERIRRDINISRIAAQTIDQRIDELDRQVTLFESLDDDRARLATINVSETVRTKITALIANARGLIMKPDFAKADVALNEIDQELLQAVQSTQGLSMQDKAVSDWREALSKSRIGVRDAAAARELTRMTAFARVMAFLAGTAPLSARDQYRYWAPLFSLLLLIALVLWGASIFYSGYDNNTFGANRIADYFPLFLWGFGTDVVNKALQGIRLGES